MKKSPEEKKFLLTPEVLEAVGGVSTFPVHQMPGDVVVSVAGATHGGMNLGLNYAEAVNFVDEDWVGRVDDMIDFYNMRDKGTTLFLLFLFLLHCYSSITLLFHFLLPLVHATPFLLPLSYWQKVSLTV